MQPIGFTPLKMLTRLIMCNVNMLLITMVGKVHFNRIFKLRKNFYLVCQKYASSCRYFWRGGFDVSCITAFFFHGTPTSELIISVFLLPRLLLFYSQ